MKSTSLFGKYISKTAKQFLNHSLLLCLALAAWACGSEEVKPETANNCSGKSGKTVTLKMENAICGVGVWGSLWFENDNSLVLPKNPDDLVRWLQPYSLEKGINYTPKAGEILKITYTEATLDDRYNTVPVCMAYPGKSLPIHILCIEPVKANEPLNIVITKQLVVRATCSGSGVFGEKWFFDENTNTFLQPCKWIANSAVFPFADLQSNDKIEVSYTLSSSKECQNNFPSNNPCFAPAPQATPIDIWSIKKVK